MKEESSPEKELKKDLKELLERIHSESSPEELTFVDVGYYSKHIGNLHDHAKEIISKLKTIVADFPKMAQDLQVLLKELDDKYQEIEKLIENIIRKEIIEDLFVSEEVKSNFINALEKLHETIKEVEEKRNNMEERIKGKSVSFKGREKEDLKSLIGKIIELREIFHEMRDLSYDLASSMRDKQVWKGPPEVPYLLHSIRLGKEIWSHDFVVVISGLRSVAGDPYTEEVKLNAPFQPDDEGNLTIDQLLLRYPPFEPIHVDVDGTVGRFVWFVEPKNAIIPKDVPVRDMVEIEKESDKLISVTPIDLLSSSGKCHEIIIEIEAGGNRGTVFVKYGSESLCKKISNKRLSKEVIEQIQREYENYVKHVRPGRTYSVTNLGYVWYCILGRGLSTDPYDLHCPFAKECVIGKTKTGRNACDKWSWSRRLFPKVFVVPERKLVLSSVIDLSSEDMFLFMKPLASKGARVYELYQSAQWYMPSIVSEGPIMKIRFKNPIKKSLLRTNVIGFVIPLSLVKAMIRSLLDENNPHKPEVTTIYPNKKVSLDKLLVSKFYIYKATKEGIDSFSFLQKDSERIIEGFKKFHEKIRKENRLREKLIDFLVGVVGHTLAHLFLAFISSSLEIEPENLLYIYEIDKKEDTLLVAVAENSAWGSLDIVEHAKSKFGSLHAMLQKFVNDSIGLLEMHEKELISFLGKQDFQTNTKLNSIAGKVKEIYESFSDNGVILDTTIFLNHIVLSEKDRKIAEELKGIVQDTKELREWLTDAIVTSRINTCVDGCTSCVMLERGCTAPLLQNVLLSRNLTLWMLKVLSGREPIKGRGDELGLAIFNQAKERFFAFSPYVDDRGAKFLAELAQRGVKVVLVTYENNALRYRELLGGCGVDVYVLKTSKISRHDKFYVIDRRVQVMTSQNLSNFSSINDFMFKNLGSEDAERIEKQELESGAVERYRGCS